ncbi:MAG: hypothetical protein HY814_12390 [Candidatus Riflebacteria bacterium]|nr:hypothetical protein [Candidatus Riflebacteria bacterium]
MDQPKLDIKWVLGRTGTFDVCLLADELSRELARRGYDVSAEKVATPMYGPVGITLPPDEDIPPYEGCAQTYSQGRFGGEEFSVPGYDANLRYIGPWDWAVVSSHLLAHATWRTGAQRVLIPMAMAAPSWEEPRLVTSRDMALSDEVVAAAQAALASVYPLQTQYYDGIGMDMPFGVLLYIKGISGRTGGITTQYPTVDYGFNPEVRSETVQKLADAMGRETGNYTVTYTTPDATMDGAARTVVATLSYQNAAAQAEGTYRTPFGAVSDVAALSLEVAPSQPAGFETSTLTAVVKNLAADQPRPVTVQFFDRGEDGSQVPIGFPLEINGLAMGETQALSAPWLAVPGRHELTAVVDPDNTLPDGNPLNNSVSVTI